MVNMKGKVVHCKKEKYDIYIGRGSKWGNPFKIPQDGDRKEVVRKYHTWVIKQEHLMRDLHELKGKVLGCYCAPLLCHGDILLDLAEADDEPKRISDDEYLKKSLKTLKYTGHLILDSYDAKVYGYRDKEGTAHPKAFITMGEDLTFNYYVSKASKGDSGIKYYRLSIDLDKVKEVILKWRKS